jgi:hypothetical protein
MRLFQSTPGGKAGAVDGLNLFFGALLGANLGTVDAIPLWEYFKLMILLAGTVMTIRMVSTSERRGYMLFMVVLYGVLLAAIWVVPDLQPEGMSPAAVQRLIVTLAAWIVFVVGSELTPVREHRPKA